MTAPAKPPTRRAAGPLGKVVKTQGLLMGAHNKPLGVGANSLVALRRTAFVKGVPNTAGTQVVLDTDTERAVLRWAADHGLGQDPTLIRTVDARRRAAMRHRVAAGKGRLHWERLTIRPLWRIAVGLGAKLNAYEIGIALHGTYGCPVIPGSTVKGVTRAWAEQSGDAASDPALFAAVFGLDRDGGQSRQEVVFLDALPAGEPVTVVCDTVTVHQQPYYGTTAAAPGEHHQPVPSTFLTVQGGRFAIDLLGGRDTVTAAAAWCTTALDELGIGAKTAAGYGYAVADGEQP